MPHVFPWWTFVAGLAGAAALVALRRTLSSRLHRPAARVRHWKPKEVAELLLVSAVGLVLRLLNLHARPLDNDEPVTVGVWGLDEWAANDDARLHPPLPGLLMRAWTRGEMDPVVSREVSVLAGVACVALAFALGRRAGGRLGAWIAALLVAMSPVALQGSQLTRGYALLAFGVLLAHQCLTRALQTQSERWWLAYSGAVCIAALSEYLAIAPLLTDAIVAGWFARVRVARIGVATAFGSALALLSFLVPFATPTVVLGVGGGPHAPTGFVGALRELGAVLSGSLPGWAGGVLLCAAALLAVRRRSMVELRLLAQIIAVVLVFFVAAELTLVRGRYIAHAWPLIAGLCAAAVGRHVALGLLVALTLLGAHGAQLPGYYAGARLGGDVSAGPPIPKVLERLRQEPTTPIVVAPYYGIGEPVWRLARALPGPVARAECPARLCVETPARSYYGVTLEPGWERPILERHPDFFLVVRYTDEIAPSPHCRGVLREADTLLFRCGAR